MGFAELGQPWFQPQLGEVGGGGNMQFLPALKIELAGYIAQFGKCTLQMRQRCAEFGRGADTGTTAHDKFNAQKVFKRLDPLSNGGSGQSEQFTGAFERPGAYGHFQGLKRLQVGSDHHSGMVNAAFS